MATDNQVAGLDLSQLRERIVDYVNSHETIFYSADDDSVIDRNQTVGSSEFGCPRKKAFQIRGTAKNEGFTQNRGYMLRGHVMEPVVANAIRASLPDGWKLILDGEDQRTMIYKSASATRDGVLLGPNNEAIGLEIKTTGTEVFELIPRHGGQTNYAEGLSLLTGFYPADQTIVVYMHASNYAIVNVFLHQHDPALFERQLQLAEDMLTLDPTQLPALGVYEGFCRYCEYSNACNQSVMDAMPEAKNPDLPAEELEKLLELAGAIKQGDASLSETKSSLEAMRERLKVLLRNNNARSYSTDWFSVNYSRVAGRETLDRKLMEQDGLVLEPYLKQSAPSERLTISFKGAKA